MARAKKYPGATQKRWSGVRGVAQSTVSKLVLHSTETPPNGGCPGYGGGTAAPTLTINPWPGREKVWQHFDANESAKALVDPGATAVRENRDNVAQVEIIGYSDVGYARKYGGNLRELPQSGIDMIAKVIAWYNREWDVPIRFATPWPFYPGSYGNSRARMSGGEYDRFTGVLGHLHVSGNVHGDPSLDLDKLIAATKRAVGGPSEQAGKDEPKPWDEMNVSVSKINWALAGFGRYSHSMKRLQEAAATFPKITASAGMVADGTRGTWNFDKDKSRMQDVIDQIRDYAYVERAPKGKVWPEKDRRGSIGPTSLRWILNAADFDNPVVD